MARPVFIAGSPVRARRVWDSQEVDSLIGTVGHMYELGERREGGLGVGSGVLGVNSSWSREEVTRYSHVWRL